MHEQGRDREGQRHAAVAPRRRRAWRRVAIAVAALVAVVAVGGAVLYQIATKTSVASGDAAVEDFRASPPPDRAGVPGLPAQGVYMYSVTGTETIGGPVSISRDLPSRSPRIVRHTDAGYEIEWRLSGDHTESWGYRLRDDGAHALFERSRLGVLGISVTTENAWSPPPLRLPSDLEVGRRWTAEATDPGGQRVDIGARVTGEETLEIDGEPVTVSLIESNLRYSGDVTGEIRETSYYDPESDLEVRHVSEATLDDGSSEVTTRWDATLESLEPMR